MSFPHPSMMPSPEVEAAIARQRNKALVPYSGGNAKGYSLILGKHRKHKRGKRKRG